VAGVVTACSALSSTLFETVAIYYANPDGLKAHHAKGGYIVYPREVADRVPGMLLLLSAILGGLVAVGSMFLSHDGRPERKLTEAEEEEEEGGGGGVGGNPHKSPGVGPRRRGGDRARGAPSRNAPFASGFVHIRTKCTESFTNFCIGAITHSLRSAIV